MFYSRWRHSLLWLGAAATTAFAAPEPSLAPAAIEHELRSFREMGTVLHIGAHPDDENTQLITYFSRGRGYRTGYLSLTRGDGGQNELGRDFDEKLGVARTQELLAARRLDGGRQFFTRAIDFGYSKTPEETLRFWDRDQVLADVVRVIRQFRPDVIITRFPIPPGSGGHGHHTASAMLAVEAFKLAGDPKAFPDQLAEGLAPWQPKRVVWNSWNNPAASGLTGPVIQLDIAGNDPVTGEPFGTIANRSRGMHKTQGLGGFSDRGGGGPNVQSFMLLAGEPGDWPGRTPASQQAGTVQTSDLMDGVNLTWNRVPGGAEIGQLADEAIAQFKIDDPAASIPALLAIRAKLTALPADPLVTDKRTQLDRILQACLGLQVETLINEAEVVPGEPITLRYTVGLQAKNVSVRHVEVRSPALKLSGLKPGDLTPGVIAGGELTGVLPAATPLTQPYWLRADGTAGISRVGDPTLIGRPENPPAISLEHVFSVNGQMLVVPDEPRQLIAAVSEAQSRRRVAVIPPISLTFGTEVFLFKPGQSQPVTVEVAAARAHSAGTLRLDAPAGWQVTPATQKFSIDERGGKGRSTFTVMAPAPARPDSGRLTAWAEVGGRSFSNHRVEIRYDHIPLQLLQPPARARVASFDLAMRALTVGYLPGAGDSVAECLAQMGCTVRLLTGADLTPAKLQGVDAVVIGVRAFNERTDLAANLPGLFAYVEAGGTVIAQYNRPNGLKAETLGPYPLSIQGPAPQWRVTDENAPVTFLAPDHPALNVPNKITAADFAGWVQERGAYFPSSWDEAHYTAVLATNDPGEAPLRSSLLVAKHGQGYFVYTGLAFFRQLPAGSPGAYRLFANLVSLGK